MVRAAKLVDWVEDKPEAGDRMRLLLKYWKAECVERKNRRSAVDEVWELISAQNPQ
ncbi:hypothetical protein J2S73_000941 [Amorphus orientalis]|uniref:Uncharacterized protein n=1 Tax=Amorphus orientalis TaxID=649198 RepID=A0AAE4ASZ9_9HYPH|nr:hypothetical protein [Amorphus orientalis]